MDGKLEVQSYVQAAGQTVLLSGELDMSTADELVAAVDQVCATGPSAVTLDAGDLTFIDSMGLCAVLKAKRLCEDRGIEFRAIIGAGQVGGLFDPCGMSEAPNVDRRLAS